MKKNKGLYPALIQRLGEMVKENVELEQRVHQLTDDYNRVARMLREKQNEATTASVPRCTLGQYIEQEGKLEQVQDCYQKILSENKELNNRCDTLEKANIDALKKIGSLLNLNINWRRDISRYEQSELMQHGELCPHNIAQPDDGNCVRVGDAECGYCCHFTDVKSFMDRQYVLCAYRYDMMEGNKTEAQQQSNKE